MTPSITHTNTPPHKPAIQNPPTRHPELTLTKFDTWNIDRQAIYDSPINTCVHENIDILHCTEPTEYMTPGTRETSTLINTADKAGYAVYVTTRSHTCIRQATIYTRIFSQRSAYNV